MKVKDRFARNRVVSGGFGVSETDQSFKDECDVNFIMERARRGIEPRTNPARPQFGDFSNVPTFQEAFEIVRQAGEEFKKLPAALRRELEDNPANLESITEDMARRYNLLREETPEDSHQASTGGHGGGTPPVKKPKASKAKPDATPTEIVED